MHYRIEFDALDPATGLEVRHYAGNPGGTTSWLDDPATAWFAPRIALKPVLERYLYQRGTLFGRSVVGLGSVTLINRDGWYDTRIGAVDGRRIAVRKSATGTGQYPADWELVLIGTMAGFELAHGALKLILRDRQAEVADRAVAPNLYGGGNALPDGVDGEPGDLEGKAKPRAWGVALNVSPPMVNRSKRTYQALDVASSGPAGTQDVAIDAVYTQAAAITAGTDHASLADLQAATVTAATVDSYDGTVSDGAYFRTGSSVGTVTCDLTEGASAADRTAAQIMRRVVLGPGGLTEGDLDDGSFAVLDGRASWECGIWVPDAGTRVGEVLDAIAGSVGGWWIFGRDGRCRVGRLELPAGQPVAAISGSEILRDQDPVRIIPSSVTRRGLPPKRVIVEYARNWTVLTGQDITGAVAEDAERARWVAQETRSVSTPESAAIVARHPLAEDLTVRTLLALRAAAEAEAARILAMLGPGADGVEPRFFECDLHMSEAPTVTVAGVTRMLDLDDVVTLTFRRFGLAAGRLVRVIGVREDHQAQRLTLTLWG